MSYAPAPNHLSSLALDSLQPVDVSLVLWIPHMWPCKGQIEGNYHFPWLAGHILANAGQGVVGLPFPACTVTGLSWPMDGTVFVFPNLPEILVKLFLQFAEVPGTEVQNSCLSLHLPAWSPSAGHLYLIGKQRRAVDKLSVIYQRLSSKKCT